MPELAPPAFDRASGTWNDAVRDVNAWRGQAIQVFAKAEAAVSETLLEMNACPHKGAHVRLRRLVGQRFEDLRAAIGEDGPFATEGEHVRSALADYARHEWLRPMLCHGVAKVALDRQGEWLVLLRVIGLRSRGAERDSITFEKKEAGAALAELKRSAQRLSSQMQVLHSRLAG